MEHAIKAALMGAVLEGMKETQEKRAAFMPKFETEEAVLKYARRVVSLRAGDTAKILNEDDTALMDAIFTGSYDGDGGPIFLAYSPKYNALCTAIPSWHGVVVD